MYFSSEALFRQCLWMIPGDVNKKKSYQYNTFNDYHFTDVIFTQSLAKLPKSCHMIICFKTICRDLKAVRLQLLYDNVNSMYRNALLGTTLFKKYNSLCGYRP